MKQTPMMRSVRPSARSRSRSTASDRSRQRAARLTGDFDGRVEAEADEGDATRKEPGSEGHDALSRVPEDGEVLEQSPPSRHRCPGSRVHDSYCRLLAAVHHAARAASSAHLAVPVASPPRSLSAPSLSPPDPLHDAGSAATLMNTPRTVMVAASFTTASSPR